MRIIILFLATFLASCSTLKLGNSLPEVEADWRTEGRSPARNRVIAHTDITPPLAEAWRYNATAGFSAGSPLIAGSVVFVSTRKGEIHALDLMSGERLGLGEFGEAIEATPAMTSNTLYIPNAWGNNILQAYDYARGRTLWKRKGIPIEASLLLLNGILIAADVEGHVRAIEAQVGTEKWTYSNDKLTPFMAGPVATSDGRIILVDTDGQVTALDVADGSVQWEYALEVPVYATPALLNDTIFIPTTTGELIALDIQTGAIRWTFTTDDPLVRLASPAVTEQYVVFGGTDGQLRAIHPETGRLRWTFTSDGAFSAAPLIAGEVVYIGAMDKHLFSLDLETGHVLWQTELKGRIKSAPALHKGHLIVLSEPKYVYAFRDSTAIASIARH